MATTRKRPKGGISAWLVTWEASSAHVVPPRKIAAVYNPRWSPKRVKELVELLYVNSQYVISEQINYANNRNFNPYPAAFHRVRGVECMDSITCGHNPFLKARLVDNLIVTGEPDDEDMVQWNDRESPDFDKIIRKINEE